MEIWYIGFRTRSLPDELTKSLERLVRNYKLDDFVTKVCYEHQPVNKKIREYYYFLGVKSDIKGDIPQDISRGFKKLLENLNLRDDQIYVYYDEIRSMASKEIETFDFRYIKRVQPQKYMPTDPFDFTLLVRENASTSRDRLKEKEILFNQLLFCLSAYGRGTWQQFRSICSELRIDLNGEHARRISRRLRSLGHIELSKDGQNWFAAPTCLVNVDQRDRQYHTFLAGQRSQSLVKRLQEDIHVTINTQPDGNAPEQVLITFPNESAARSFVQNYSTRYHPIYLAGHAGLTIANLLPNLDEWEATLPVFSIVKANYHFERWYDGKFETLHLPKETGMYRLTHTSERFDHPQMTLYYNALTDTWKRADWYGIRFLTLRRTGTLSDVFYDPIEGELSIPFEQRWPDLYERSLVLASGQLPTFRYHQFIYSNISVTQAHILADKLGVNLIEHRGI